MRARGNKAVFLGCTLTAYRVAAMLSKPVPSKNEPQSETVQPRLLYRTVKVGGLGVASQLAVDRTFTNLPEKKICLHVIYQNDV